jgi:hypothetical protein
MVGQADREMDYSYIHQSSISPHPQNQDLYPWTKLIELLRDSWHVVEKKDPDRARVLVGRWKCIPYPIFRRLVFYAMDGSKLFKPEESLEYLLEADGWWLWSIFTQRELYRLLSAIWPRLSDKDCLRLTQKILLGPPRNMFREDLSKDEWMRLRDREIWLRLAKLESYGRPLPPAGSKRLSELSSQYPEWKLQEDERDEFPSWMETRWGHETDYTSDDLLGMPRDEMVEVLLTHQTRREGLMDGWREAARKCPRCAVTGLLLMAQKGKWVKHIWHSALNGLRSDKPRPYIWRYLGMTLLKAPDEFITEIVGPLSSWLPDVTKSLSPDRESEFWSLWDRLIQPALSKPVEDLTGPVTKAINSPAGNLTEALLERLWARRLRAGQGIPNIVHKRITDLAEGEGKPYILSRVILASRLHSLYVLDREWTEKKLIPYFDWGREEDATAMWQGYLWASVISPGLLTAFKNSFLEALRKKDKLGDYSRKICQLFAVVCMESAGELSRDEMREVLKSLDPEGRAEVVNTIYRRLKEVGENSESFWTNRVSPWLTSVWPKDRRYIEPKSARYLALAAVTSGRAFQKAIDDISKFLVQTEDFSYLVHRLSESRHPEDFPQDTLRLLGMIVSTEERWPPREFRRLLNRVKNAYPQATETGAYQCLDEYLRVHRL